MALATSEQIHPTAVVSREADLAPDVQVGPYAIIEGPVQIGPGCLIEGQACLSGPLTIGANNYIGHGAVIGKAPQSRAYKGQSTRVEIGENNVLREYVTIHRGTVEGGGVTVIGSNNMLMVGSHVGHDVIVGNGCTLVNNTLVAGHAVLGDSCILSGHTAIQQRVRVGRLAMLAGMGASSKDIPPFVLQQGYNCVTGLNIVGLRRAGTPAGTIDALRASFRILYKEGRSRQAALERILEDHGEHPEVVEFVTFIQSTVVGINPVRDTSRQNWDF